MLSLLDELLRQVLLDGTSLTAANQVWFEPPDGALRAHVLGLNQMVLSLYLVELRENRRLRSNERVRTLENGFVFTEQAPERVDCHYLASAWSPAQASPGIEPTVDEHALLYEAIAALLLAGPLTPARVYAPADPRLALWPQRFRSHALPAHALPVEGFGKLSEFWTTMGADARWKPVIPVVVTLPVALVREMAGPMVTTSLTTYQQDGLTETANMVINIGGHVRRTAVPDPLPVAGAWVRLETTAGMPLQAAATDDDGRFLFDHLEPRQYQLRAGATGLGPITRVVDVPSETGEYDLQFP